MTKINASVEALIEKMNGIDEFNRTAQMGIIARQSAVRPMRAELVADFIKAGGFFEPLDGGKGMRATLGDQHVDAERDDTAVLRILKNIEGRPYSNNDPRWSYK